MEALKSWAETIMIWSAVTVFMVTVAKFMPQTSPERLLIGVALFLSIRANQRSKP